LAVLIRLCYLSPGAYFLGHREIHNSGNGYWTSELGVTIIVLSVLRRSLWVVLIS